MERIGPVREIQGGGSGIGFETPGSMIHDEPRNFQCLTSRMLKRAKEALNVCSTEEERALVGIWNTQLQRRLYKLHAFKKKHSENSNTATSIPTSNLEESEANRNSDKPGEGLPKSTSEKNASNELTAGMFNERKANNSIVQYVPRLPRDIDDVVKLWRFGNEVTRHIPVRLLRTAAYRKKNIPNYSNQKWIRSGQKCALQRLQKLVLAVAKSRRSSIRSIDDHGNDDDWKAAVQSFRDIWGSTNLSTVLRKL